MDDYIFDRPATDAMMRWMEEAAGVDKIVNGNPEPPDSASEGESAAPAV